MKKRTTFTLDDTTLDRIDQLIKKIKSQTGLSWKRATLVKEIIKAYLEKVDEAEEK